MTEIEHLSQLVERENFTHLVFDLDETLIELNLPWQEWIQQLSKAMPQPFAAQFSRAFEGQGPRVWPQVVNDCLIEHPDFYDTYVSICRDFEGRHFAHTPYDELINSLPKIQKSGAQLYLWTNNVRETAERALNELGIRHLFKQLSARDDTKFGKPDLEGFHSFGINSKKCLLIGDSKTDEIAAKAADISFFKVSYFK